MHSFVMNIILGNCSAMHYNVAIIFSNDQKSWFVILIYLSCRLRYIILQHVNQSFQKQNITETHRQFYLFSYNLISDMEHLKSLYMHFVCLFAVSLYFPTTCIIYA